MAAVLMPEPDLTPNDLKYTALEGEEKQRIIDHINEEHFSELVGFIKAFTPLTDLSPKQHDVRLVDIYAQGIGLQVSALPSLASDAPQSDTHYFIDFPKVITHLNELQYQYIALKQQADKKLRKKTIILAEKLFQVKSGFAVTDNMYRLLLSAPAAASDNSCFPVSEAGYAYLFDLSHNLSLQTASNSDTAAAQRTHRYYTLRKVSTNPTTGDQEAWVDVFLHGETLGAQWLAALTPKDTVKTKREVPENIAHLQQGQSLLIADETSIPTVARLLELWQNPIAPLIIYITQKAADQAYLQDRQANPLIDDALTVLPVMNADLAQGAPLAELIAHTLTQHLKSNPIHIQKVWGALETSTSKALRALLKPTLNLDRSAMIVKGYWRQD